MDEIATKKPKKKWLHLWESRKTLLSNPYSAWFLLVASLLLTLAGWYVSNKYVQERAFEAFNFEVLQSKSSIGKRLQEYELTLRGGQAFFDSSGLVERAEWKTYVETLNLERYYPGIQGMGFTRWIPAAEREKFENSIRAEGYPDFKIWPEQDAEFYSSIIYLEPFVGRNLRAFGYDMFSEPIRRAAMEKARDTGMPAISGKVRLVQETNQNVQNGFLLYLPIYDRNLPLKNLEDRRSALRGFVYSPFRIKDLMVGILKPFPPQVDFEIYDGDQMSDEALLYSSREDDSLNTERATPHFQTIVDLQLQQHSWTLHFKSNASLDRRVDSHLPELVALIGVLFDALLFFTVWTTANQRKKIHQYAEVMTAELALERSFLGALIENLSETIIASNAAGDVVFVNQAANKLFRFNLQKTPMDRWVNYFTVYRDDGSEVPINESVLFRALRGEPVQDVEKNLILRSGARINIIISGQPLQGPDGRNQGAVVVVRDITNTKQTQKLRESEARFRLVFEAAQSAMVIVDRGGLIQQLNAQMERIFGYSRDELVGRPIELLVGEALREQHAQSREEYQQRPEPRMMGEAKDLFGVTKQGQFVPIEVGLSPIRAGKEKMVLAVVVDNSERKQAEQVLLNSIREKETLLKEIHHRVKNNMQVINSLLNLQCAHTTNDQLKSELTESQMRIKTMALIHQLLYENQDFSKIHLQDYIERLVKLILAGYSSKRTNIKLKFELDFTPVYLDLNRAIPCGLVVNELVTNVFKHAFFNRGEGVLIISLERLDNSVAVLKIKDNGVGLPLGFGSTQRSSLGLQLVTLLTDQLEGEINITSDNGTCCELKFKVEN